MNYPPLTWNRPDSESPYTHRGAKLSGLSLRVSLGLLAVGLFCAAPARAASRKAVSPPANLAATPASSSQINLSWVNGSSTQSGVIINRGPSSTGPWTQIVNLPGAPTTYANSGLASSTTYYYEIYAYNNVGGSTSSSPY